MPDGARLEARFRKDLLGGVAVVTGRAESLARAEDGTVRRTPVELTAIPYYAWAHRGPCEMAVWLARDESKALKPVSAPTLASRSRARASHSNPGDTIAALNDQVEPSGSGDSAIPRFTWWDHLGTAEWVEYEFSKPATVSAIEVYWFDDIGLGQFRAPKSWRLLYKDGGEWKPVKTDAEPGTKKDQFNRLAFEPVLAEGLRIEVQLQPGRSGGLLEWKVQEAK